jgi:SAM-dependent methyltransferase
MYTSPLVHTTSATSVGEPEARYRQRFLQQLLFEEPQTVLDVGCGGGETLLQLKGADVKGVGVDSSPSAIARCQDRGVHAQVGDSNHLPFANGSFDWVISQYVAHHLVSPAQVAMEMLRVAQRGVLILDVWYDPAIPGGACARKLDHLLKQIDQENGEAHFPVLEATQVVGPALYQPGIQCNVEYLQSIAFADLSYVQRDVEQALNSSRRSEWFRAEWAAIRAEAESTGILDEGAMIIKLVRSRPAGDPT